MHRGLMPVIAALALTRCGRVGYEPLTDAAIDGPIDTPDAAWSCPAGMVRLCPGTDVCIDVTERGELTWTAARDQCVAAGARLCADAEWALACTCEPTLVDMYNDQGGTAAAWEWVAEESGGIAQKRGFSACGDTSTHPVTDQYDFRCCADLP